MYQRHALILSCILLVCTSVLHTQCQFFADTFSQKIVRKFPITQHLTSIVTNSHQQNLYIMCKNLRLKNNHDDQQTIQQWGNLVAKLNQQDLNIVGSYVYVSTLLCWVCRHLHKPGFDFTSSCLPLYRIRNALNGCKKSIPAHKAICQLPIEWTNKLVVHDCSHGDICTYRAFCCYRTFCANGRIGRTYFITSTTEPLPPAYVEIAGQQFKFPIEENELLPPDSLLAAEMRVYERNCNKPSKQ